MSELQRLRDEMTQLRAAVAQLQANMVTRSQPSIRFAEGLLTESVTIEPSQYEHSFSATTITIRVFRTTDRDGVELTETGATIEATAVPPGEYTAGCYAIAVQFGNDGVWRTITLGCNPTIEDYVPNVIPE
ncbi:hypothetical protein RMSM_02562 [Rhodopirellula maiorica SM1]|uniref:Uncharacterized protein n=1 Tax=Rhodopirellula maiorica SM1 TaxID=1265738 RepID=M5RMJ6_9BACT|nr:hypothetical protein [Rhodopirellula maiorica]EMI20530.1 hypothetical protein RMSM_02562 [Rhodopirellula maiorica SM1]